MLAEIKDDVAEGFITIVKLDNELKVFHDMAQRIALECKGDPAVMSDRLRPHVNYIAERVAEAHAVLGGGKLSLPSTLN